MLNASDQQIYTFGFANNPAFDQIASDGGLLNAPVRLTRLTLGPAERAEIVIDLAGVPLALQRFGGNGVREGGGFGGPTPLLTIQPSPNAAATNVTSLPSQLNSIDRTDLSSAAVTRQMVLGGGRGRRTINGLSMQTMAETMDSSNAARVGLGDVERWDVVNRGGGTHLFHIHDVQFQIVSRNGATPGPGELGRKDTVQVRNGETVTLLIRFTDYFDADTPYMYHCHILQHEHQGMTGQFLVVPA